MFNSFQPRGVEVSENVDFAAAVDILAVLSAIPDSGKKRRAGSKDKFRALANADDIAVGRHIADDIERAVPKVHRVTMRTPTAHTSVSAQGPW